MKKVLLLALCCIFITVVTTGCGSKQKTDDSTETATTETKPETAKSKYIKMAEEANKKMPAVLPGGIRMDKIEAVSKNEYRYTYTFIQAPVVSAEEFVKSSKLALAIGIRESKADDLMTLKKDKMTIVYAYYTMDGKLFAEIKIKPEEYK